MGSTEKYFITTPNGLKIAPLLKAEFFENFHESIRSQFFGDEDTMFRRVAGEMCEITLPPAEEIVGNVDQIRFDENRLLISISFPAMILENSEEKFASYEIEYVPPEPSFLNN